MKKTLLSALAVCGMLLSANAQTFTAGGTGFLIDYSQTSTTKACINATASNNGNIYQTGGNTTATSGTLNAVNNTTTKALVLTAKSGTLDPSVSPVWFDVNYTQGSGTTASCTGMRNASPTLGVDMTSNATIKIFAKSDVPADLYVWIGSSDGGWNIENKSTYNINTSGASIIKKISLTSTAQAFTIDLKSDAGDGANFDAWTPGKTLVNLIGFTAGTANAVYTISQVALGSANLTLGTGVQSFELPSTVSYYPNPATSAITVDNMNVSTLKLMNTNGVVVKEVSSASTISVEGLNPGMYFLQINEYKPVKVNVQ